MTRSLATVAVAFGLFVLSLSGSALAATGPPANDGQPTRWYGVLESLFVFDQHGTKTTIETSARATFTLAQNHAGMKRYPGEYDYVASGTLRASYVQVGGDCSWRGSDTIRIGPSNGGLRISITKRANRIVDARLGWLSGVDVGGHDPILKVALRCPDYSATVPESITWLGVHNYNKTTARARAIQGRWDYPAPAEGFRTWCLTRKQSDLDTCKADELEAVARVSGSTLRAAARTLDGSRSKGDIKSYEWTFAQADCTGGPCAGYCDTVGPKGGAKKRGARVTIKPLCAVRATLTVTDGQDEDSDSVDVRVTPRSDKAWRTRVTYREKRAPMTVPWVKCAASCQLDLDGGMNTPDPTTCPGQPRPGSQILCPLLDGRSTWLGAGYTLATVSDPGGPFDGYSYVASSSLAVNELGILNQYLFPEAGTEIDGNNFYTYNAKNRANVAGFLKALSQHEGWGAPGKPRTGHAQVTKDDLATAGNDPRREIEQLFSPTAGDVQQSADRRIKTIDMRLQSDTCDHGPGCSRLNEIGKFDLFFFHPTPTSWTWDKTTITVT